VIRIDANPNASCIYVKFVKSLRRTVPQTLWYSTLSCSNEGWKSLRKFPAEEKTTRITDAGQLRYALSNVGGLIILGRVRLHLVGTSRDIGRLEQVHTNVLCKSHT
jgi:hypothetical protein